MGCSWPVGYRKTGNGIQKDNQRNTERQPMGYRKTTNGILKNAQWKTEKDEEPMR